MGMGENLKNNKRILYKLTIYILKIIPIILGLLAVFSTILDYINYSSYSTLINYIMFFCIYLFLYLVSYIFHFCEYHRVFLHYIVICNIIKIIDYYITIPISNFCILQLYSIITMIALLLFLYLYVTRNK